MHQSYLLETTHLQQALAQERPRLVQLCTYWLGDVAAAEDVVQETLLEAWRKIDQLRDPQAFGAWLTGIARNMARRRLRRLGRDLAALVEPVQADDPLGEIPASFDFEAELDRADLSRLLDQALALLPEETRQVLIQKYIEDSSHQAIAEARVWPSTRHPREKFRP